jgi:parallel beta-helix repeat protein
MKRKLSTLFFAAMTMLAFAGSAGAVDGTIEINQAKVMAAGGFPYVISTANTSYRLTGSLTVSSTSANAINVSVSHVTIDLNGFSITGAAGSDTYGINATETDVTVENGTITGFEFGAFTGNNGIIRNVHADSNGDGIATGANSLVQGCTADSNTANGIYSTGSGLVVSGNSVNSNGKLGIGAGIGSTISGNSVYSNSGSGIYCNGGGCLISNNTIDNNNPDGINADSTTGYGGNVLNNNGTNVSAGTSMKNNVCNGALC